MHLVICDIPCDRVGLCKSVRAQPFVDSKSACVSPCVYSSPFFLSFSSEESTLHRRLLSSSRPLPLSLSIYLSLSLVFYGKGKKCINRAPSSTSAICSVAPRRASSLLRTSSCYTGRVHPSGDASSSTRVGRLELDSSLVSRFPTPLSRVKNLEDE